jgi:hypothetical protein
LAYYLLNGFLGRGGEGLYSITKKGGISHGQAVWMVYGFRGSPHGILLSWTSRREEIP